MNNSSTNVLRVQFLNQVIGQHIQCITVDYLQVLAYFIHNTWCVYTSSSLTDASN